MARDPEEFSLSLKHQNPSKTVSLKTIYFDRVTVSLHILYTASQGTEGSQDRLILYDADFLLGTSCCAPARIWLADIDLKSG